MCIPRHKVYNGQHQNVSGHLQTHFGQANRQSGKKEVGSIRTLCLLEVFDAHACKLYNLPVPPLGRQGLTKSKKNLLLPAFATKQEAVIIGKKTKHIYNVSNQPKSLCGFHFIGDHGINVGAGSFIHSNCSLCLRVMAE
jgi:hypothetical protein